MQNLTEICKKSNDCPFFRTQCRMLVQVKDLSESDLAITNYILLALFFKVDSGHYCYYHHHLLSFIKYKIKMILSAIQ